MELLFIALIKRRSKTPVIIINQLIFFFALSHDIIGPLTNSFELCTLLEFDYLLRACSLVPIARRFLRLGSMAKLEGVEKAPREAAQSIGITQLKYVQKDSN